MSSSDESVDSINSKQMYSTASCQDTPDTESESESRSETEFTLASASSSSMSPIAPDISSGPEDFVEDLHIESPKGKRCVQCRVMNSTPFPLCRKCFRDRKRFLPARPIHKRSQVKDFSSGLEGNQQGDSSQTPLCESCANAPSNGVFVHGETAHQLFCFTCSQRVWQERKLCPYCNRTITKVVRLFKV